MKILILGSGAFAREVYDWVTTSDKKVVGFFSGIPSDLKTLRGLPIYYDVADIPRDCAWIVGTGNPKAMIAMISILKGQINPAKAIVHPSCTVGSNVTIGDGTIICPGTIVTCDIVIGQSVAVNIGCTIGHDTIIGSYVHLSPNVSLSGNTQIGDFCEIGTGASTNPGVTVPPHSIIGAGAVVNKSLSEAGTYIGLPAKKIR